MYNKIFLVFIIYTMLNIRGHALNSFKGDVRQNLKMAYFSESHFKQFMLYNVLQNVFHLSTSGIFKFKNTSEISTMGVQESFLQVSVQNAEFWYNFRF